MDINRKMTQELFTELLKRIENSSLINYDRDGSWKHWEKRWRDDTRVLTMNYDGELGFTIRFYLGNTYGDPTFIWKGHNHNILHRLTFTTDRRMSILVRALKAKYFQLKEKKLEKYTDEKILKELQNM